MNEEFIDAQPEQTYTPYTPEMIAAMPGAPVVTELAVTASEVVEAAPVVKEVFVPVEVPASTTAAANNLGVIIASPKARKAIYAGYVALSFLITNTVVAFSTLEAPIPDWLKISLAVLGNSAVAFGSLAIANTDSKDN